MTAQQAGRGEVHVLARPTPAAAPEIRGYDTSPDRLALHQLIEPFFGVDTVDSALAHRRQRTERIPDADVVIKLTRSTDPPAGFAGEQRIEKNLTLIRLRQERGDITARTNRIRATRAIRAAEEDLGLNREELRRRRWRKYEELKTFADVIERFPGARTAVAAQIRAMMAPDSEYAAMARYFVRVEWRLDVTTAEEQVETPVRQ